MATYATQADFVAYSEGLVIDDVPAVERLLVRAERDLDQHVFVLRGYEVGGLKWLPTNLDVNELAALKRATCAQAEYRLAKTEDFFVEAASGPKDTREPRIGPKVYEELAGSGLIQMTGRLGPWRGASNLSNW